MKNVIALAIIALLILGGTNFLEAQKKSTTLALGLSIGVPAIMCGAGVLFKFAPLAAVGVCVGPSLGHFYAKQWTTGLAFTGLCTAAVCVAAIAASSADQEAGARVAVAFGGITYCVVTITDWVLVPFSVRRYNKSLQIKPEINLNEKRYGVGFVYHF